MPRTKTRPLVRKNKEATDCEVLTLAEAAAYLRLPEVDVLRLVQSAGLPGRAVGDDWRFLKTALQDWLRTSPAKSTKEDMLSLIGAWKDDSTLDELVAEIYRQRGRPMTEDEP
jgi:excisionase family DNA binding protein